MPDSDTVRKQLPETPFKSEDSTTQSLFENSLLEPKNQEALLHKTPYDHPTAIVLFIAFCIYVYLYTVNRKRLNQVVRAFYISRFSNQLSRDEVSIGNRVSVFLSILFVITLGLFLLQVNAYFGYFSLPNRPSTLLLMLCGISLIYFIKVMIIKFLGFIFQTQKEAGDYIFSLFLFGNSLGLFLMPLVIMLAFAEQLPQEVLIYTGLVITAVFICTRLIRGIIIGVTSHRVSNFYLFLYLCTLEILPFVVLAKMFVLSLDGNSEV